MVVVGVGKGPIANKRVKKPVSSWVASICASGMTALWVSNTVPDNGPVCDWPKAREDSRVQHLVPRENVLRVFISILQRLGNQDRVGLAVFTQLA